MKVIQLIEILQSMPSDLEVYWDNPDREADKVSVVSHGPYCFSMYKRIKVEPYFQYLGEDKRDVVLLSRDINEAAS